jgi:hypothetical protein
MSVPHVLSFVLIMKIYSHGAWVASSGALTLSMGFGGGGGGGCEGAPPSQPWSNIAWVLNIARTSIFIDRDEWQ